jgi:hypothetical protein
MRGSVRHLWAVAALGTIGCSGDIQESAVGEVEAPIVRATAQGGKDQVVMLYMRTINSAGNLGTRTCSGTYIANRLVLTAAHCLTNIWQNQLFVYWGQDFAADLPLLTAMGQILVPPAPGEPSVFAQADSYETHPEWDPVLLAPDIGAVYLDRKLPFAPLPVARFRLDRDWVNEKGTLVGWGASQALTADISQTVGGRIQRTGQARIMGSPTVADYHPEDPNPGMLVPRVRRNTLKTDGRAPNSNACAGDSGGPLLVRHHGESYVAGVGSFTGLFCEDYSLFTRIDPFLPFIDAAVRRAGKAPIIPHLECVAPNSDGTFSAYFGYENENGVSVEVPKGYRNFLPLDTRDSRPSEFLPGRHDWVFGVDFAPQDRLFYWLSPDYGRTTVLHASKRSPLCGDEVAPQVACGGFCRAGANAGCPDVLPSNSQCMQDCLQMTEAFPECGAETLAMNQCYATTPPGEDHWLCNGDDFMPSSFDCGDQEMAFVTCLFGG